MSHSHYEQLLGLKIDIELSFNQHFETIIKKPVKNQFGVHVK